MDFMEKRRGKGSRRGRREVIFFCSLLVSALIGLFWHDRQSGLKDDIALTFFFFFVFSLFHRFRKGESLSCLNTDEKNKHMPQGRSNSIGSEHGGGICGTEARCVAPHRCAS